MFPLFRLYWLRETGCDAGTPLRAAELEPAVQQKVLDLAAAPDRADSQEIILRLPYLDQREWRNRDEILAALPFERRGGAIAAVLPAAHALRDAAANFALASPAWQRAPATSHPRYFPVWQNVSMTLQRSLRDWIAAEYFQDATRYSDRDTAYPMICYQTARVCHGRPRSEFTYDLRDYPECRLTLALSLKMTGVALQSALGEIEQRLQSLGMEELSRRYRPVWYQDILVAVRKKPRQFIALLAAEIAFINALIELGLDRTPSGVHAFAKTANQALRKVHGMDVRHLGIRALEETTRALEEPDARINA